MLLNYHPAIGIHPPLTSRSEHAGARVLAKLHSNPLRPDTKFIRFLSLSHVFIRLVVVAESKKERKSPGAVAIL